MRVTLWGTRGSIPTPGPAYAKYGGHTPCVEIETNDGTRLILDGGMGLHPLGKRLVHQGFAAKRQRVYILLTHTHWDHIQGLPFFLPLLMSNNHFTICGCGGQEQTLEELLRAQMEYIYCPVPNFFDRGIGAKVDMVEIGNDPVELAGARIIAQQVNHGDQVRCLGYRIESDEAVLCYLPDVEYKEEAQRLPALELAHRADLLLHDAHYSNAEYSANRGLGHACAEDAWKIAQRAKVGRLAFFHHHPDHRDEDIAAIVNAYNQREIPVEGAREGHTYYLGVESLTPP